FGQRPADVHRRRHAGDVHEGQAGDLEFPCLVKGVESEEEVATVVKRRNDVRHTDQIASRLAVGYDRESKAGRFVKRTIFMRPKQLRGYRTGVGGSLELHQKRRRGKETASDPEEELRIVAAHR